MIKIRIPTAEPFAFIELEVDDVSADDVKKMYDEYTAVFKAKSGLNAKEWNDCLDNYRREKKMDVEMHAKMSLSQQWMIHELDKSNLRLARAASDTKTSFDSIKEIKKIKE